MIDLSFLLKGVVIGFSIAAPVGPIGLLCIQRTLAHGRVTGLVSGLGAATADAVYGLVAGFGVTLVSKVLLAESAWIQAIGGVALCCLGIRIAWTLGENRPPALQGGGLWWQYASTALLTLANPVTILLFLAVFTSLGITASTHAALSSVLTVLGIFTGSALWWLALSTIISLMQRKLTTRVLVWISRGAGVVIVVFGAMGIVSSSLWY